MPIQFVILKRKNTLQHLKLVKLNSKLVFEINKMEGNIICIPRSAHRTPNFTNPEYFVGLLYEFFFPDKSFKLMSKYTQKCQYNLLY